MERTETFLEVQFKLPKGYFMSEVQFKATMEVAPAAAQPLAVTPSTEDFPSLQVGVEVADTVIAEVTGGVPPYNYALDANSDPLPPGITFAEDGNGNISLDGTPTEAGDFGGTNGILLDITDSAGTGTQLSVKKNVVKKNK